MNGIADSHSKNRAIKEQLEHDTCDACDQPGQFVCCDLCPRVFHFFCADPPMSREAIGKIDHWFCRECAHRISRKRKSRAHVKNIFYPLISSIEFKNPRVFAVPDEIRRQFDGVERDIDGTFINVREDRAQRVNAGPANRDFTRLVDDHNETILCYRCGLSALHGLIVRCDYCPLNWHWDCLDPPLCSAPPPHKRWMCPNHADHAMRRHRKFRKERVIDLSEASESARNNGIVDIIDDDPPAMELFDPKVKYKIPSSHIRNEFVRHALPCVVDLGDDQELESDDALDEYLDVDDNVNNSTGSASSNPQTQSTLQLLPPPVMTVAEWLQSIVAFQQDVARFVMTTAKQTVLQDASNEGGTYSEEPSADRSKDDKIAILSNIAAQVLSPLIQEASVGAGEAKKNVKIKLKLSDCSSVDNESAESKKIKLEDTAISAGCAEEESDVLVAASALKELPNSVTGTKPDYTSAVAAVVPAAPAAAQKIKVNGGIHKDCSSTDSDDAEYRRKTLFAKHGLSEAEAKDAIERLFVDKGDNSSDDCTKRKRGDLSPDMELSGKPSAAVTVKRVRSLENGDDGFSVANSDLKQGSMSGLCDGEALQEHKHTNGDHPSLARVALVSELVTMLLREKGTDALLNFLAS
ncbi:hypothetical protein LPJ72_002198 [Coemansia sp. Benny D160-2]|nr:hypothetical protein LPJ72_002198 [Coemansia sp. Benny D160-2]